MVFFDNNAGYWLVHSVPKFPLTDSYVYPDNGMIYAQSMLCMSFKYSELSKIGTQLYYNHPEIYSSNLPTSMAADNPDLAKVIGGQYKSGAPYSSTLDLTTAGGTTFKSFAKSADFNQGKKVLNSSKRQQLYGLVLTQYICTSRAALGPNFLEGEGSLLKMLEKIIAF